MQRDLNYAYFARVQNGHAYANHNHQSELITNQIQHEDWRAFSVGAVWLFNKIACPLFQDLTDRRSRVSNWSFRINEDEVVNIQHTNRRSENRLFQVTL